jgi:hypothetical protein
MEVVMQGIKRLMNIRGISCLRRVPLHPRRWNKLYRNMQRRVILDMDMVWRAILPMEVDMPGIRSRRSMIGI